MEILLERDYCKLAMSKNLKHREPLRSSCFPSPTLIEDLDNHSSGMFNSCDFVASVKDPVTVVRVVNSR
jgi:hypothetical protein